MGTPLRRSILLNMVIVILLALLPLLPSSLNARAQDVPPPPDIFPESQGITSYSPELLDQILAPIALYPDPLVAQILMAATYPFEVADAARWLQDPDNAAVHGDRLVAILADIPWDPSVKALVLFPGIVRMMGRNLQWTEQLGDAFIGEQAAVMDQIQRLRRRALTAGTLHSTPFATVTTQDGIVFIASTNPDVVYIPLYDPLVVYGAWPYPEYPPAYFTPDSVSGESSIEFRTGIFIDSGLFFYHRFDFHHHRIDIDDRRFRSLNGGRPPLRSGIWTFDPAHRHEVPHLAPPLRGGTGGRVAVPPSRQPFRGFGAGGSGFAPQPLRSPQRGASRTPVTPSGPSAAPAPVPPRERSFGTVERPPAPVPEGRLPSMRMPPRGPSGTVSPTPQRVPENPPVIWLSPPAESSPPRNEQPRSFGGSAGPPRFVPQPAIRRSAPVFESHTPGFNAREQSARGQASRSPMAAPQAKRSFEGGEHRDFGGEHRNFGGEQRGGSEENRSFGGGRGRR